MRDYDKVDGKVKMVMVRIRAARLVCCWRKMDVMVWGFDYSIFLRFPLGAGLMRGVYVTVRVTISLT